MWPFKRKKIYCKAIEPEQISLDLIAKLEFKCFAKYGITSDRTKCILFHNVIKRYRELGYVVI